MSTLLDQAGVSVHCVSGSASDLQVTQGRVSRDGTRRNDIGRGGGGRRETRGENSTAEGSRRRSQRGSERNESGKGSDEEHISQGVAERVQGGPYLGD